MKLISQELIDAIERERQRQEQKFPGQKLPATSVQRWSAIIPGTEGDEACRDAGVVPESKIKEACDERPDWSRVLVEEVSEAISAAGRGDADHACKELIEVAAVAIRFHDALRRGECGL